MIENHSRNNKSDTNEKQLFSKPTSSSSSKITLFFAEIAIFVIGYYLYQYIKMYDQPSASESVPVIGILSKPLWEENYNTKTEKAQVIEGKYVRWVEGGGGRAIYINWNSTDAELKHMFNQVNGLLLIGGATKLVEHNLTSGKYEPTPYIIKVKYMVDLAMQANKNGDYFPIFGICLGFEDLILSIAEDYSIMKTGCDCFKYNDALKLTPRARNSRMFSLLTKKQIHELGNDKITYNSHNDYFTVKDFQQNKKLSSELKVLSTSTSKNNSIRFISAVEGTRYPFYAFQFHPEKNAYDFNPNHPANHSKSSIMIMQTFPVLFVDEARKNKHIFKEDQTKHSVYNGEQGFDSNIGSLYLF